MQEADAEHRMRVLRARASGMSTPPPPLDETRGDDQPGRFIPPAQTTENDVITRPLPPRKTSPVLTGPDGHINLFASLENPRRKNVEKNAEHEAEKKAKEEKLEAQYTMGLGKPAEELRPWYSTLDMVGEVKGRKKTEWEMKKDEKRKDWGDPLVAIKRGVRGVKEVEEERREWKRSRELEVGVVGVGLAALDTGGNGGAKRDRSRSRSRSRTVKRRDKSPDRHHDRSRHRHRHRSRSTSTGGHRHHSHKHSPTTGQASHRHRRSHHQTSRSESNQDIMERLRRERDQREKAERDKAEAMLRKEKEYHLPGWKPADGGRYSSQFGVGEVRKR